MQTVDRLRLLDASFLYLESAEQPMNIASVQLLELPDGDVRRWFRTLRTYLADRVGHVPFMTRRLRGTPLGLDQPVWVPSADFSIDCHLHLATAPAPGERHQLEDLVARLHEQPLPRSQPLWSMHVIQGLGPELAIDPEHPERTVVLYSKYHHACIDGMAGQGIVELLFSTDPDVVPPPCPPGTSTVGPNTWDVARDTAGNFVDQAFGAFNRWGERSRAMRRITGRWLQGGNAMGALGNPAPRTPFNTSVGQYRSWAMSSLPLREVRAAGKTVGASINDVLLAICAGGVRRWLERQGKLPDAPLRCGVPMSLRALGDSSMSNQVSMLVTSLATDIDDPLERMQAIRASMASGVEVLRDADPLTPEDLHLPGLSTLLGLASSAYGRLGLADLLPPMVNLVVSNVKGPRQPMWLCGARMHSHHPVSIPAHGVAMNITVQSYCDHIDLGVTACLEAVPDTRGLRDDLDAAWQELRRTLLPAAARPRPATGAGASQETRADAPSAA